MRRTPLLASALALATALACGEQNAYVEPPPPAVTVARPTVKTVVDYAEFTGTTRSINTVEIRARIRGFLEEVRFTEGAYVKAGDLLYVIEPDEYEARVRRSDAALAVATTGEELAKATLARMEQAYQKRAVSELELLESRARAEAAGAQVDAARAELQQAQLDLGYTRIHAPIGGRVGRTLVDPGNLVGDAEKTLLTKIVQYDPIYAYFDMSERSLLRVMGATHGDPKRTLGDTPPLPVDLGRASDEGFPFQGHLDFTEQEVDASTGTFLVRAVFPNPQPVQLLPGLFVRVRIPSQAREGALLVDDRAIGADQSGKYVLVVDDENVVQLRSIEAGALVDGMRVIDSGLESDDWVVVKGLLRARPGSKVSPEREGETPARAAADAG